MIRDTISIKYESKWWVLKEKLIISVIERLEQWYQDTKKEAGSNKKGHNLHAITKQYSYIEDRMLIQTQQQTIRHQKINKHEEETIIIIICSNHFFNFLLCINLEFGLVVNNKTI